MKKLIVITSPNFFKGEDSILYICLMKGCNRLHLRKPDSDANELRKLLDRIPDTYYPKVVLHDCFGLVVEYGLGGIHLNRRNNQPPDGFTRHNQLFMPFDRGTRTVRETRLSVS